MEVFRIIGGKKLSGSIEVCGSKNATTPILAATLLGSTPSTLSNIPRIEDVFRMLEILESLGAHITWENDHSVTIDPSNLSLETLDQSLVKKLRSSILLLGALSARFDTFLLEQPGGCVIGARPVDTHTDALQKLGVKVERGLAGYLVDASERHAASFVLRECSVTATENALMLAASIPGESIIHFAATEPHVQDLCYFLVKMGAVIEGIGTHTLTIRGTKSLSGAVHNIIPDANEAATFLILGVATKSPITVLGAREEHLHTVLEKLREFGAAFSVEKEGITVVPNNRLVAARKVDTMIYPGIPTDTQAPFGVLATQAEGETLVHDPLFEGRFNYVPELLKMNAKARVLNPHQVEMQGPSKLRGTTIKSYDLRAGAALIIAALCAEGETVIEEIYQVDRGYERIEERLQKIGADITREKITL